MGGGFAGDDGLAIYGAHGKPFQAGSGTTNGWGNVKQNKAGATVLEYNGIGTRMGDRKTCSTQEFIELMWNYICDQLED